MSSNVKKIFAKTIIFIFIGFILGGYIFSKYGTPNFLVKRFGGKQQINNLTIPKEPLPQIPLPNAKIPKEYLSFPQVVNAVEPTVVNIDTTFYTKNSQIEEFDPFGGDDFFNDPFFKFFFKNDKQKMIPRKIPQQGKGSGFIINKKGFILTNNHVISGAKKIIVKLVDGRKYTAKVIGKDKKLDVAVLKIDAPKLQSLQMGNSKNVQLGEWVIAIGNPFGFEQTVTAGIISGKGRRLQEDGGGLEDLIQTDAAINRGNSGGPLVNLKGEVIAMNTAIYSPSGGSVGIGFAIPINNIKSILKELIEKGKVIRPWIGIYIATFNADLAKNLKIKVKNPTGAIIEDVAPGSPGEKAGLKRYDVIQEINRKNIKTSQDVVNEVKKHKVGDSLSLLVLRVENGIPHTDIFTIKLAEMP